MESNLGANKRINTQADAIVIFIQRLDIEMIELILDENRTYQNYKKAIFIQKLASAFNDFILAGDKFLHCYNGYCNSKFCHYKCIGFSFVGNNSGNYLDLIVNIKDGFVYDIYECILFNCLDSLVIKNKRIEINKIL